MSARDAALAPPDVRGRTEISERVLEKIASHVLAEVSAAGGVSRRTLGVSMGRAGRGAVPKVDAQVDGELATLRMTVSVAYPEPVRAVTRHVRERVAARVGELTGLQVRQVDVDVDALVRPERGRSRQ